METSILVAQIVGLAYILFGLGMLLNGDYYRKAFDALMKDKGVMIFGGIMSFVLGFVLITYHNIWVKDWTVLVTIIGWLAFLKGVMIFLMPKFILALSRPMLKNTNVIGVGVIIMGLVFSYFGFLA